MNIFILKFYPKCLNENYFSFKNIPLQSQTKYDLFFNIFHKYILVVNRKLEIETKNAINTKFEL